VKVERSIVIKMYKQINSNSVFFFSEDMELMLGVLNILEGEEKHQLCTKLYGEEYIGTLKKKYHFLVEIAGTFNKFSINCILEHLLNYPLDNFHLSEFRDYILNLDTLQFLAQCFYFIDKEELEKAVKSDEGLEKFYLEHDDLFCSFLGLQSFIRQRKRYLEEFLEFSEELRTPGFQSEMEGLTDRIKEDLTKHQKALVKEEALEYSQKIMGKTFHNRGPYSKFLFSPSLLLPYRALRFFGKDQILFYTLRPAPLENEMMLKQLKTIADSTRLKIISLLNTKEPLRGLDIAQELSLAPSTVSHHMDQLKNAGIVNEEQEKNSKYYSISRNNVDELLRVLTETLGNK